MRTSGLKEMGRKLMVIGGVIFTSGAGMLSVGSVIDYGERKKMFHDELHAKEMALTERVKGAEKEAFEAKARRDDAMARKLAEMDKKEFAMFKATEDARVSQEAIDQANRTLMDAENKIAKMKLECSNKIMEMEIECAKKVEDSTEKYMKAKKDYDDINRLFTNRDEILRAEEKLRKLTKKKADEEKSYSELIEKLEDLLDD